MTPDEITTITEPRKRGRPPKNQIPAGKRGTMKDGIRKYLGRDGRTTRYQVKIGDRAKGKTFWRTYETEAEAKAARDAFRVDRAKGRLVHNNDVTVAAWATAYADGRASIAATTKERYQQLSRHIENYFGATRLQDLTPPAVELFRDALAEEPYKLGPRTREAVLVVLKAACAKAVKQAILKANPCEGVEMPKGKRVETEAVLSPSDLGRILRCLAGSEFWLPVAVLAYTGLRRGELCALRWRGVDLDAGTLHVGGTVQHTKAGLKIEAPKRETSRRTILIDKGLVEQLRRHKMAQAELGLRFQAAQTPDWLVFPAGPERPTTPRNPSVLARSVQGYLTTRGIPGVNLHALRHAHATALLDDGASPKLVATRLGHSVAQLLRTYAHVIDRAAAIAADKFAARVAGSGSGIPGSPDENGTNILVIKGNVPCQVAK